MFHRIDRIRDATSHRCSSWDTTGRNQDWIRIPPGQRHVLADCEGPGRVTHIWMAASPHLREVLLQVTVDGADSPQINVPLGDFFCLGHGMIADFQNLFFTCTTNRPGHPHAGGALNCYLPMPFKRHIEVALVNQGDQPHQTWFYVDWESCPPQELDSAGILHAEFRRTNPFGGWGHEITVNTPEANAPANLQRWAWDNNYVILDTKGRGHYVGCNLSVTNFQGTWWGEGDDMIWVDGYKWPPDLHGTGSEDYLSMAWGMQKPALLRNGSSLHEADTGGWQTSYVFHVENPVHFRREIKVTIEHGHANHLANEMSSVAYWYAAEPTAVVEPPPVSQRLPVRRDSEGNWLPDPDRQCPGPAITPTDEMRKAKADWANRT